MDEEGVKDLEVVSIIGFDGNIPNGLHCHPDQIHLIYPIGNSITIQNTRTKQQEFLNGHTNTITAVNISNSGKYIASGQINHMGFKSMVILWDFERRCLINKYEIHKVRVECVVFTCDDTYLITLGGRDDTCVVVYDIIDDEPLCGSLANGSSTGNAMTLCATSKRGNCFLSAGDKTLRFWTIDKKRRKTFPNEVNFNKIKRLIHCLVIDDKDEIAYCGTSTGDVAKVYFGFPEDASVLEPKRPPALIGCFGKKGSSASGNAAECYSQGVRAIVILEGGNLIIGAGDGIVEQVKQRDESHMNECQQQRMKDPTLPMLVPIRKQNVDSCVSSMKLWSGTLYIGTVLCEIYTIDIKSWSVLLKSTCHTSSIYDVCFPSDFSAVFATCSKETIRIWNTETSQEMLRIKVHNFTCSGVCFYHDGKGIVSSWNDGTIRAFTPQTGKLMYIIHNAHNKGVSAINITKDNKKIVSGGGEGQVRVWDIKPDVQSLRAVLQEHKGPVSALHINYADDEAASASTDGSCIIWDIVRCVRKSIIFSNTLFMAVRYHPSDCQILTTGTNRKISYWEAFDGSLIRDVEGSTAAGLNAIDISPDGEYMVSGGNDQLIKLWTYQTGLTTHVGLGHAGIITCVRFSPDSRYIVTVSADGGIYRWKNPYIDKQETEIATQDMDVGSGVKVTGSGGKGSDTGSKSSAERGKPSEFKAKSKLDALADDMDDIISVISEPGETNRAKPKELEESIRKSVTVKCKCGKKNCRCPKVNVKMAKRCKCNQLRCNCKIVVAKPDKSQSQTNMKKGERVPRNELGRNSGGDSKEKLK